MEYTIKMHKNGKQKTLEGVRVKIDFDERRPEMWNNCFSSHGDVKIHILDFSRNYLFNQKDFGVGDWDVFESQKDNYFLFWLDFYDHTTIKFTIGGKYREDIWYYEFDRTRNVGVIAVDKKKAKTEAEALDIAEKELDKYNKFINWRIYYFCIEELTKYVSEDWEKTRSEWDFVDWIWWYIDFDECKKEALDIVKNTYNSKIGKWWELELIEK